jgi:hypothetical protein
MSALIASLIAIVTLCTTEDRLHPGRAPMDGTPTSMIIAQSPLSYRANQRRANEREAQGRSS